MNGGSWPPPVTITDKQVSLVGVLIAQEKELVEAAADGELHRSRYTIIPSPEEFKAEVEGLVWGALSDTCYTNTHSF